MRKKWTVTLTNEERTWSLPMGTFWKRKNAIDFAVDLLDSVDVEDAYVDDELQAVVSWTG
jgi:hypothetical protein